MKLIERVFVYYFHDVINDNVTDVCTDQYYTRKSDIGLLNEYSFITPSNYGLC